MNGKGPLVLQPVKLNIEFDGWHCLSKKQNKEILLKARSLFKNANFFEGSGLIIQDFDELKICDFCIWVLENYKSVFGNWNGYTIKKISKRTLYHYADRKRKLSFNYFLELIKKSDLEDAKIILAGILYLDVSEVNDFVKSMEKEFEKTFQEMDNEELEEIYKILLMFAAKDRKFSLKRLSK